MVDKYPVWGDINLLPQSFGKGDRGFAGTLKSDELFVRERAEQCLRELESAVGRERVWLGPWRWEKPGAEAQTIGVGFRWTGQEEASWLRMDTPFAIPEAWAGERVGLWIEISGVEPLLYLDGQPAQALDYNHQDVLLHDPASGNERHTIAIECYAPTMGATGELKAADLVRIDRNAYSLYYDFRVAVPLLEVLPAESREGQGLRLALEAAMNALDYTRGPRADTFYASLPAAARVLREGFFDAFPADPNREAQMVCAGHSHLDLAYLWAIPNTRKKVGRTFASVLRLMDEFPNYHFTHSQPQTYAWAKSGYPELYARIQARVQEGRWEPTGGMWVEADCNVTGGESLIRQFLFGNRFFQREFGVKTRVLWLPDVFGYSAALPQIIKGCGLDYFMTTKISWSQFNRAPYDTFFWRGIDGTEALTHFVTSPDYHAGLRQNLFTYNGKLTPSEIKGGWDSYRQKAINSELLELFGAGDGGGGPTRHLIETGRRLASIAGIPRCRFGGAEPFFDRLHERVKDNPRTPRWVGELYLENHRGTYTSQGRLKRANRQNEIGLRNAEIFSALALVALQTPYPQTELNRAWETLLLNQFHDILPGTCVPPAVEQSLTDHAEIARSAGAVLDSALGALAAQVETNADHSIVVFNPTDTLRPADILEVSLPANIIRKGALEFADEEGIPLLSQFVFTTGGNSRYLVQIPDVGALGYRTITAGKAGGASEGSNLRARLVGGGGAILENDFVRVTFDAHGEIVSLIHFLPEDEDDPESPVREREVIEAGQRGNALVVYEDRPYAYDAWNIDIYYEDKPYPLREIGAVEFLRVTENGPVRACLQIQRRFLQSVVTQRITLMAHSPRLTFHTTVDWQERQMLLKVAFPVAVQSPRATYEIQFGSVERPTHRNTSWDVARFEVCAHKWADLSEGDYGVSLLNDSKYGYDCQDNVLRLTLLKAGNRPDPEADKGPNEFTYALLPHTGDWRGETVDDAYALNYPLLTRYVPTANPSGTLPPAYEFATVDDQGIVIEAIKKAEDSDGILIRLYEAFSTRGRATLTVGFPIAEAFAVNLVEENPEPIDFNERSVPFDYRPFEIKTFLIMPAPREE